MLVVGARLRGNETLKYTLRLPRPLLQIDADPQAHGRGYSADHFLVGDAKLALAGLAARLKSRLKVAAGFGAAIATARTERKSVASGKSEAVRVDSGGVRLIKKKKKKNVT